MNANELKDIFNTVIAQTADNDKVASLETLREYFTNPEFKTKLQEFTFNQTQKLMK